jgi:hypothetical protein
MIGFVSGYANPVTITITQSNPVKTWTVTTGSDGYYDTGCVLTCPGTFTVTATKPNSDLKFSPSYKIVTINNCCPNGYARVDFDRIYHNGLLSLTLIKNLKYPLLIYYLTNDPNPLKIYPI